MRTTSFFVLFLFSSLNRLCNCRYGRGGHGVPHDGGRGRGGGGRGHNAHGVPAHDASNEFFFFFFFFFFFVF